MEARPNPIPFDIEFGCPREAGQPIYLSVDGHIRNEGKRTVEVLFHGSFRLEEGGPKGLHWGEVASTGAAYRILRPSQDIAFRLDGTFTLEQWARNCDDDTHPTQLWGEIRVDDRFDNGVHESWIVTAGGRPSPPSRGFADVPRHQG